MAKDDTTTDYMSGYQSALAQLTDQIKNKKPIQYDPHLGNLVARYFALPEMWPKDWDNTMKKSAQDLYKSLPKDIVLTTMRDLILVVNIGKEQIIVGFYNGDIYTYNLINGSWVKEIPK
jgi:hypothetical protein